MSRSLPPTARTALDQARVGVLWRALPWRMYTTCSGCGEVARCAGKVRARMVCAECYLVDPRAAKRRRARAA